MRDWRSLWSNLLFHSLVKFGGHDRIRMSSAATKMCCQIFNLFISLITHSFLFFYFFLFVAVTAWEIPWSFGSLLSRADRRRRLPDPIPPLTSARFVKSSRWAAHRSLSGFSSCFLLLPIFCSSCCICVLFFMFEMTKKKKKSYSCSQCSLWDFLLLFCLYLCPDIY